MSNGPLAGGNTHMESVTTAATDSEQQILFCFALLTWPRKAQTREPHRPAAPEGTVCQYCKRKIKFAGSLIGWRIDEVI